MRETRSFVQKTALILFNGSYNIHIILSLMNDFITELLISAICATLYFHR